MKIESQDAETADETDDQTLNRPVMWNVYIVRCNDGTLYTGITTDVARRVSEHNGDKEHSQRRLGAAYTRARRPVQLVYLETANCRSSASKREWSLKRLTRADKLQITRQWLAAQPVADSTDPK